MSKTKAKHPVRFGAPPPRRNYHWDDVAEQLRAKPGEWALVHEDLPSSVAWAVNAGRVSPVAPARGFETQTDGNWTDEHGKRWCRRLYMRYVSVSDTTSKTKRNGAKK